MACPFCKRSCCVWCRRFPACKKDSRRSSFNVTLLLGLEEDYSLGKVIMNPYTWGDNSRYGDYGISTIQADDINGANALY